MAWIDAGLSLLVPGLGLLMLLLLLLLRGCRWGLGWCRAFVVDSVAAASELLLGPGLVQGFFRLGLD